MKYTASVYPFFVVGQVFDKISRLRSFAMVAGFGVFPVNLSFHKNKSTKASINRMQFWGNFFVSNQTAIYIHCNTTSWKPVKT